MTNSTATTPATAIAAKIGRLVEANLTNWATGTMTELSRADAAGQATGPLLHTGLAVLRARQHVRAGIVDVERTARGAAR